MMHAAVWIVLVCCSVSTADKSLVHLLDGQDAKLNVLTARVVELTSQLDMKMIKEKGSELSVQDLSEQLLEVEGGSQKVINDVTI